MRSENSMKNATVAIITNLVTTVIGLVVQAVFLKTLGTEYLGINGLFTNLLSILGIVELGLGSAIIYHLYEPIAKNNIKKIQELMCFYRKCYHIIAGIMLAIGIAFIPFLDSIVGEVSIEENIAWIYFLFLIDIVVSYLLTYKRSILYANQKMYVVNIVHIGYLIGMNLLNILVLLTTKDFIIYLWVKIIFRLLENIVITIISNKRYPYIKNLGKHEISTETKRSIITKVKGLLFHKIGTFVVLGTDNIIISKFLGIVTVGLYSNYQLVIQAVRTLANQIFSSLTASIGNLLVEKENKKSKKIYNHMLMLNSWFASFVTAGVLCIMEPFIIIWIGAEYLLPIEVLVVLSINLYMQIMRSTCNTFKEAAGVFYEDRMMPVIESIINIVASVILVQHFGLVGVFLGTIISTLFLFIYSYPKYVYFPLFGKSYTSYMKDYIKFLILDFTSIGVTYVLTKTIQADSDLTQLLINAGLVITIPNVIHYFVLRRTDDFKYYKEMIKSKIERRKNKEKEKVV